MSQPPPTVAYSVGNKFAYATPGHLYAAAIALPVVALIVVGLRLYTRLFQRIQVGIDDYLTIPAAILVVGMGAAIIVGVANEAVGYPTPPPPAGDPSLVLTWTDPKIVIVQKVQAAHQLLMVTTYGFIKISILYFYRRIFVVDKHDRLGVLTHVFVAVIVAWSVGYLVTILTECGTHFSARWGSIADLFQHCLGGFGVQNMLLSLFISDLITNFFILVLPLPRIWHLHLTPARKAGVSGIILMGGVATGAAAARLYVYVSMMRRGTDPTLDQNMAVSTVLYWSMIEAGLALIAACLPTTQHLVHGRHIASVVASVRSAISLPSLTGRSTQNSSGNRGGSASRGARRGNGSNNGQLSNSREADEAGLIGRLSNTERSEAKSGPMHEETAFVPDGFVPGGRTAGQDPLKTVTIEMTTQPGARNHKNFHHNSWEVV